MEEDNSLLKRLTATWNKRAQVKKEELLPFLDENFEDFIDSLLPFAHSPAYQSLSASEKSKILTCGWLLYNFKTIQIESRIVSTSCLEIIKENSVILNHDLLLITTETFTDEAYHIYLMMKANQFTAEKRGIVIHPPLFNLIKEKEKLRDSVTESWQKYLIELVFAIVSEVYIGDYLDTISYSYEIQPFNQMITMIHRKDELAHRKIFKEIAKAIFMQLNIKQKDYFASIFPLPLKGFFDMELEAWQIALNQIKCRNVESMISDAKSMTYPTRNYTQIVLLAKEIGILELQSGRDAFFAEKIISTEALVA